MGDGRYYTPDQFFNIIIFTSLIICIVIAFMNSHYKVETHKKYIQTLGLLLLVSLVSSFIFEIAYSTLVIYVSNYIKSIALFLYFLVNTMLILKNRDDKKLNLRISFLLLCIPTVVAVNFQINTSIIYVLFSTHFIIVSNRFAKYKVSSSVFNDVKKLMLDYVFIISINGDVIFRNDKTIASDIFKDARLVDVNNIPELFTKKTTIRNAFSKQLIKFEGDEVMYFQYHRKEIAEKGALAGYILTFVDITGFISLLDKLSDNREETRKANLELDQYKDIVYDIEKEKEMNILLDEIANNQQKSMYILKDRLENLDIEDDSYLDELDTISDDVKLNLADVRAAVTSYINFYG